ncbi:nucleotidyl transferase AbiEii/AbiGii toxin family protein [Massilia sp. erpn]|uniref:nucleotidyl transferase AbiEii/AbiGii toxin family protein n=1 Tax=Massilia sp. erpn TaxID=2738142 RepID=UPI002105F6CA|nr:nucleotidyl transferase AbiEii/AbiGii toxin family protein [Massilia sp. erpn]UTY57729.1 hypothetical protein HPQ68_11370 [Massilia sp. erpn]
MATSPSLTPNEPQTANDYDERTTEAVKSVLVEVGQILGAYKGKFAIVGGSVPWLLIKSGDMSHVGTMDLDIALHAEALGDGEYASLIESLFKHGYTQGREGKKFQLRRSVYIAGGGGEIEVVIDFLMPRDAEIVRNFPPMIDNFAVQRADGADLALEFSELLAIQGVMPNGAVNKVEIAVCSIPALLAMKGHALAGRYKQKDAYDIYYCVRGYEGGIDELAKACMPVLQMKSGAAGFAHINDKFSELLAHGPVCVRDFVRESRILGDRSEEQWQQDAFGQVDALMRALGLRS